MPANKNNQKQAKQIKKSKQANENISFDLADMLKFVGLFVVLALLLFISDGVIGAARYNPPPETSLNAVPTYGYVPLSVSFYVTCSDNKAVKKCILDYGDGIIEEFNVPRRTKVYTTTVQHMYSSAGAYTAVLNARDRRRKGWDPTPAQITIRVNQQNQPPQSYISADPAYGNSPLTVNFSVLCDDSDSNILSVCTIFFGDGYSHDFQLIESWQSTSHTYTNFLSTPKTFQPWVVARDASQSDPTPATTDIIVNPPSLCGNGIIDAGEVCDGSNLGGETCHSQGFDGGTLSCYGDCSGFNTSLCTISSNQLPTATLIAYPKTGNSPLTVFFNATCNDPDGTISSCILYFGDGTQRTLENIESKQMVVHTYTNPYDYTLYRYAYLNATDNEGAMGISDYNTITINPAPANQPPITILGAFPIGGYSPLTVFFNATCVDPDGTISSCILYFDDGTYQTLANVEYPQYPNHIYTNPYTYGIYRNPYLNATDDKGAIGFSYVIPTPLFIGPSP